MAACQDVHGVAPRLVHLGLDITYYLRRVLDFIEYHGCPVPLHEGAGIARGIIPYVGDFEVHVLRIWEKRLGKSGLPGLTGARYRDDGIRRPDLQCCLCYCPLDHERTSFGLRWRVLYHSVGVKARFDFGFAPDETLR